MPSGLKNPGAAIRGVGAAALICEALVLLLALRPVAQLSDAGSAGQAAIGALIVGCFVGMFLLRWPVGWWFGLALQGGVVGVGVFVHWSLVVVAVLFAAIWWYVLRVRRVVLTPPSQSEAPLPGPPE